MTSLYLAGIGFRSPGVRLLEPVRATVSGRTLTLDDLVATPDGTELTYHLTGLTDDEGYTPRQDQVAIRSQGQEHVLAPGTFAFAPDRHGLRRRKSSTTRVPLQAGSVDVTIAVERVGEFRLAAQLWPFGAEHYAPRHEVHTSTTHEGITVTVRGVGVAREETAIEIDVAVDDDGARCAGIGGYAGHRQGPTALSLRDERGRTCAEVWQEPGPVEHATRALFHPVHPDARELEVSVPYVFLEGCGATEAFPLPVTRPIETQLGGRRIRVLGTSRLAAHAGAGSARHGESVLGVDLDLGGWQGDRRVLFPGQILVDGDPCGVGYRLGEMNFTRPEPVRLLEVTGERVRSAKRLSFANPVIQVRGPWRIAFALT